jgi:serine protease Do
VTNAHVVTGAAVIKVHLQGTDRWYPARVVGIAPCDDVAVIQVDGVSATPVTVGSSNALKLGEEVVALGFPKASVLGVDLTVTRGVVSKLHSHIGLYNDAIQTDAAINPGNSGGPLVNDRGEVVGIDSAKLNDATGINFAISIDYVKPVLQQLTRGKHLFYLGWNLVVNAKEYAAALHLGTDKGIIVAGVEPGSPAAKTGIQPLDVVYDMEQIQLSDESQVCDILRSHAEGQALKVTVVRGGKVYRGEINGAKLSLVNDPGR